MNAGAASVSITPPVGLELSGFGAREQPSIGVSDELYAHAVYLEHDGQRVLWLNVDVLGFNRDTVQRVKRDIEAQHGLEEAEVLVSATHTHAAPATMPLRNAGLMDDAYMTTLEATLLRVVGEAITELEPVTLVFAEGHCGLAIDRRSADSPHAHVDHRLPVLAVQRTNGTYLALLCNYVMHNIGLSSENRLISADIFGVACRLLSERLAGTPTCIMSNGACGNINPPTMSKNVADTEAQGRELADCVVSALDSAQPLAKTTIETRVTVAELPLDIPSVEALEAEYQRAIEGLTDQTNWHRNARIAMASWRSETRELLQHNTERASLVDCHLLRIGPVSFVGMAGEIFSRMADDLRERCGEHVYVVGYANGNVGYIPIREVYPEGGYEVDMAYKFYGNFNIAAGGFELLRTHCVELFSQLEEGTCA